MICVKTYGIFTDVLYYAVFLSFAVGMGQDAASARRLWTLIGGMLAVGSQGGASGSDGGSLSHQSSRSFQTSTRPWGWRVIDKECPPRRGLGGGPAVSPGAASSEACRVAVMFTALNTLSGSGA